jgi:HK97 family phage portal protein
MFWDQNKMQFSIFDKPMAKFSHSSISTFLEYFRNNPIVHSIITMYSKYLSEMPIINHEQFNNWYQLIQNINFSLFITGNAFIHRETFQVYETINMKILTKNNKIHAYKFNYGNQNINFNLDEIIHLKLYNYNELYGLSPLQAAQKAIDTFDSISHFVTGLIQNHGRPSGILTNSEVTHHDKSNEIEETLNNLYNNMKTSGSVAVLEGNYKFNTISISPEKLELLAHKKQAIIEIAIPLGVPIHLVLVDENTYNNYQTAIKHFYNYSVTPYMRLILEMLNQHLSSKLIIDEKITNTFEDRGAL